MGAPVLRAPGPTPTTCFAQSLIIFPLRISSSYLALSSSLPTSHFPSPLTSHYLPTSHFPSYLARALCVSSIRTPAACSHPPLHRSSFSATSSFKRLPRVEQATPLRRPVDVFAVHPMTPAIYPLCILLVVAIVYVHTRRQVYCNDHNAFMKFSCGMRNAPLDITPQQSNTWLPT